MNNRYIISSLIVLHFSHKVIGHMLDKKAQFFGLTSLISPKTFSNKAHSSSMKVKILLPLILAGFSFFGCQKEEPLNSNINTINLSQNQTLRDNGFALPCPGQGDLSINYIPRRIIDLVPNIPNPEFEMNEPCFNYTGRCTIDGKRAMTKGITIAWFIGSMINPQYNNVASNVLVEIIDRNNENLVFSANVPTWEPYWFCEGEDDLNRIILLKPAEFIGPETPWHVRDMAPLKPGDYDIKITAQSGTTIRRGPSTVVQGRLVITDNAPGPAPAPAPTPGPYSY